MLLKVLLEHGRTYVEEHANAAYLMLSGKLSMLFATLWDGIGI